MSRVRISVADLAREFADFERKLGEATQRLREWRDDEPQSSPRRVVLVHGRTKLYHYEPSGPATPRIPVLVCYALVNRPYMTDLTPRQSLIADLLARGLDVYLIDWGYPAPEDWRRDLASYVTGDLDACVDYVRHATGDTPVNLLGICQGGVFSLCYTALRPAKVARLITTVTPVDFHTPSDLLNALLRYVDVTRLTQVFGNISGDWLNALFLAQKPLQLGFQKYLQWLDQAAEPQASAVFFAMEKWIFDSPAQAGTAFAEFLRDIAQANGLVRGNVRIGGETVDLRAIRVPVLNIYARHDHLVPPAAASALGVLVGTTDYTAVELSGGHIGIYVSDKVRSRFAETIADWLRARPQEPSDKTSRGARPSAKKKPPQGRREPSTPKGRGEVKRKES
jgi:polyhydroxyalkanoate synthase